MLLPVLIAFQLAAAAPTAGPVYHARNGQTSARPTASDATVTIDGHLDEPVWRSAALLTGFSLYQPVDGRPAPDSTEVLVWYSPTAIHFGIRAFETHGAVRATLADRDRVSNDDNIELHLDTFHEGRRAFVFIVNPLGVQADGTKNEGGGFIPGSNVMPGMNDLSADFRWESKGHITDWGYEVEVRIPFSSLRYPVVGTQKWGMQINRHVQHSGYEETWTPALRGSASFVSQAGELTGLTGMQHGQEIEFIPELTNSIAGAASGTYGQGWGYSSKPQLGGNVRWGVGSNFVLNGTIKPDFSQVESDAAQIATDERFALFYAEKRPFFVEGSEQFNVPNTLVYTRRIVRPDAAVKLTGKIGRTDVAVLSALDQSSSASNGERPMVDIVRIQQGFAAQSTAGLLYSERVGGGRTNRIMGADMRHVFGRLYYAQLQAVTSSTNNAGTSRSGPMWEAVIDRTGRSFGFHYAVLGIHPDFQTDNGFVSRTGITKVSAMNRFTAFGASGSWLERYNLYGQLSGTWKYDDFLHGRTVLEDLANANSSFTLRGGWTVGFTPTVATYAFDSAAYAGYRTSNTAGVQRAYVPLGRQQATLVNATLSTPQFSRFAGTLGTTTGADIDFLEAGDVTRRDYTATLDLRPDDRLRLTATYVSSSFTRKRDGSRSATTRIPRLKTEYQLSRSLLVRLIAQYEATVREPLADPITGRTLLLKSSDGSYQPSTARRTNNLRADFLLSYRPAPGTVVFGGYGNTLTESDPLAFQHLRRSADGWFVKFSYALHTTL